VPVFCGSVQFAIFSSCVLCCIAGSCGIHRRGGGEEKRKAKMRAPTKVPF